MINYGQKNIKKITSYRYSKRSNINEFIVCIVPVILTILSCFLIASTQRQIGLINWYQHLLVAIFGLFTAYFLSQVPLDSLRKFTLPVYIITIALLIAVIFLGTEALGAQRWLSFGGFNIQPSEIAKLSSILVLASILDRYKFDKVASLIKPLSIIFIPWILVFMQPDLGTSLVFGAILMVMLYWAGIPFEWSFFPLALAFTFILACVSPVLNFGWISLIGFAFYRSLNGKKFFSILIVSLHSLIAYFAPWLWTYGLRDYQRDRLLIFVDPSKDPLGGGYHLIQSKIGIGSGGLFGTGLLQGQLTKLNFIPEQHTDFIFSALGEETGFLGTTIVLILFGLLILQLLRIAKNARTDFESLVVIGIATMFMFQVMVNIFMTIGLGPVTGIPLPFMSYGRTALAVNFIALGLCLSVSLRGTFIRRNL